MTNKTNDAVKILEKDIKKDPELQKAYEEEQIKYQIALAIRSLREEMGLTQTELADQLGYKPRWVNTILSTLESYGYVERTERRQLSATKLINRDGLLHHCETVYRFTQNDFYYYYAVNGNPLQNLEELSHKLAFRWAITGSHPASLLKQTKETPVPMVYMWSSGEKRKEIREILTYLEDHCSFLPVGKGANVILIDPRDPEGVFFDVRDVKGLPVVSELQLRLDLLDR